jgi:hypothetical protein
MWPTFQEGDILTVMPVDGSRLRPGDCIVYISSGGTLVAHRIASLEPKLKTRGDALKKNDPEAIDFTAVKGRIVRRIRFGRSSRVAGGRGGKAIARLMRIVGRIDPDSRTPPPSR